MSLRHPLGAMGQVQQDTMPLSAVSEVMHMLATDRAQYDEEEPMHKKLLEMEEKLAQVRVYLNLQKMGFMTSFANRDDAFTSYMWVVARDILRSVDSRDLDRSFELLAEFISVCSSRRHSLHIAHGQPGSAPYSQPMPRATASLYRRSHVRASVAGGKRWACSIQRFPGSADTRGGRKS